jgi:hypothetical protein
LIINGTESAAIPFGLIFEGSTHESGITPYTTSVLHLTASATNGATIVSYLEFSTAALLRRKSPLRKPLQAQAARLQFGHA